MPLKQRSAPVRQNDVRDQLHKQQEIFVMQLCKIDHNYYSSSCVVQHSALSAIAACMASAMSDSHNSHCVVDKVKVECVEQVYKLPRTDGTAVLLELWTIALQKVASLDCSCADIAQCII